LFQKDFIVQQRNVFYRLFSIFLFFNRGFKKENVEEDERANLPDLPIQE